MISTNFDHFRRILLDPTPQGVEMRANVKSIFFGIKLAAGAGVALSTLIGASAVISAVAAPILGGITVLWAGAGFVLSKEVFVVAGNIENIFSNNADNLLGRGLNALTPDWFVASVLKNTWFAKDIFSSFLVEQLNRPSHA